MNLLRISRSRHASQAFAACLTVFVLLNAAWAQVCGVPGRDGTAFSRNSYFPGVGTASAGSSSLAIGTIRADANAAATPIAAGDLVFIIQMQGALISNADSDSYGDGLAGLPASGLTDVRSSGRYEFARVASVSGSSLTLTAGLRNSYASAEATSTSGRQSFQVLRVPQHASTSITGTVGVPVWDGATGGVMVVDAAGNLNLSGVIDADGVGFRGGGSINNGSRTGQNITSFAAATASPSFGAYKGEGIAGTPRVVRDVTATPWSGRDLSASLGILGSGYPNALDTARGAPGNAGGGGTQHNAGGGGGANAGAGGKGGRSYAVYRATASGTCTTLTSGATTYFACDGDGARDVGGFGGAALSPAATRLIMGGGGGAGDTNNSSDNTTVAQAAGGNGGGIVFIRAGTLTGGGSIRARGQAGLPAGRDGAGGGGAGGTVALLTTSASIPLSIDVSGGAGGNSGAPLRANETQGPGGGGGGGAVLVSSGSSISGFVNVAGGAAGVNVPVAGLSNTYGSVSGNGGVASIVFSNADIAGPAACLPWLTVSKSTSTPVRVSGQDSTASYTITVSNAANLGDASGVNVLDVLPVPFTYTAGSPSGNATVSVSGGASPAASPINGSGSGTAASPLSFGSFTLPGGSSLSISFPINLNSAALGLYQNPASVTYLDPTRISATQTVTPGGSYAIGGTVGGSNYASASSTAEDVRIEGRANLSVSKDDGKSVTSPGATNVYSIVVTNNGPSDASGSRITDAAVAGLSCTAVSCTANNANAACPVAGAGAGQLSVANLQNTAAGGGVQIPTLRNGGQLTLSLTCTVTASGL
ncbi:hypothetical protein [Piscinibacterium candidicorallinum]